MFRLLRLRQYDRRCRLGDSLLLLYYFMELLFLPWLHQHWLDQLGPSILLNHRVLDMILLPYPTWRIGWIRFLLTPSHIESLVEWRTKISPSALCR